MKKALIVGPLFYDYNLSIERAFRNLGFDTRVLGYYPRTVASVAQRFQYHLSADKDLFFAKIEQRFNQEVLDLYHAFKPDVVLVVQGNVIDKQTIEQMKGSQRVLWMMDTIFRYPKSYDLRNSFDHLFLFERTDVPRLLEKDNLKSFFLPLALDEKVYFPINANKEIDILFIGALYENRIALLQRIVERFPGKTIKIYGQYYAPLRKPLYHLFRKNKEVFLNKNISPARVNELYSMSKVCLNIHHKQSQYGVNQRFFEISGSKAFQLVDDNPFIVDNFSDKEITTFASEEDLFDKIDKALSGQLDTHTLSQHAYSTIVAHHTFTHRIKYLLDTIGEA